MTPSAHSRLSSPSQSLTVIDRRGPTLPVCQSMLLGGLSQQERIPHVPGFVKTVLAADHDNFKFVWMSLKYSINHKQEKLLNQFLFIQHRGKICSRCSSTRYLKYPHLMNLTSIYFSLFYAAEPGSGPKRRKGTVTNAERLKCVAKY